MRLVALFEYSSCTSLNKRLLIGHASSRPGGRGPRRAGNGVMERCIRTVKEEYLYLHDFVTLDEPREVIGAFIGRFNYEY